MGFLTTKKKTLWEVCRNRLCGMHQPPFCVSLSSLSFNSITLYTSFLFTISTTKFHNRRLHLISPYTPLVAKENCMLHRVYLSAVYTFIVRFLYPFRISPERSMSCQHLRQVIICSPMLTVNPSVILGIRRLVHLPISSLPTDNICHFSKLFLHSKSFHLR